MYAQAFGAILGLIICLYEYVYGDFVVMGNIPTSNLNILSLICGYTLYPLCITLFFMSFALNIYKEKQSTYQKLDKINKIVAHFAAGIGLLGCKYYFIIPCILILHKYYMEVLFEGDLNKKTEAQKQQEIIWLLNNNFGKHIIVKLLNVSYEEVEILNLMYCKKKKYL